MTSLLHTLQEIIRHELQAIRLLAVGQVEAVTEGRCRVRLDDGGLLLVEVPVVGGLPRVDDRVVVAFEEGDVQRPIILGRLPSPMAQAITVQFSDDRLHAVTGTTEITLDSQEAVILAGGTRITVNPAGELTIEAAGAVTVKGQSS